MKLSKRTILKIAISRAQNKLYLGAITNHLDYILDAIEEGADIHAEDGKALTWAAEEGNFEIVKFLVENGANPASNDYAAIKAAKKNKHKFIAEFLDKVTPFGKEPHEQTFKIPEIIQKRQLRPKGQGFRQPIKKDEWPEELTFKPEEDEEPQILWAKNSNLSKRSGLGSGSGFESFYNILETLQLKAFQLNAKGIIPPELRSLVDQLVFKTREFAAKK